MYTWVSNYLFFNCFLMFLIMYVHVFLSFLITDQEYVHRGRDGVVYKHSAATSDNEGVVFLEKIKFVRWFLLLDCGDRGCQCVFGCVVWKKWLLFSLFTIGPSGSLWLFNFGW